MNRSAEDALQRRIARFVADMPEHKALNIYLSLTAATDLGQSRKSNQDRSIVISASYSYAPERNFTLAVICDGIGGLPNGEEAAVLALSTFASQVIRTTSVPAVERLERGVFAANDAVFEKFAQGSGTTLTSVLITQESLAHCVNVGDSRVYGISKNRSLIQLTVDDTLKAHQRNASPDNGAINNRLLQYIGMGEELIANVYPFQSDKFGSVMLTTDGIHSAPQDLLETLVKKSTTNKDMVRRLFSVSEALGGRDNSTLVLIEDTFKPRPSSEQGLTLVMLSPSDRLEIWIPRPSYENRDERLPEALTEAGTTTRPTEWRNPRPSSSKKRLKSRRKVGQEANQNRIPFDEHRSAAETPNAAGEKPELNISFPKDEQD